MAVRCERCRRAFRNKYAVWGHLRACRPSSVEAEPAQPASSAYGLAEPGLDEELQLRRRRLELERRELEREEDAARERDMEALNTRIEKEAEAERRRGVVEEVCSPFMDLPYTVKGYQIPPGTCDAAKHRAHEALARAGGGRSREELVQIAEHAREQVYAPVLQAQDEARTAAARVPADREARLAQEREEAQRRAQRTISALPQGLEKSAPAADRRVEGRKLTDGTDGDQELEDDIEDECDCEDEPEGNEGNHDEPDDDTEFDVAPEEEEEQAPVGWGATLLKLGAIALGLVVLSKARSSSGSGFQIPTPAGMDRSSWAVRHRDRSLPGGKRARRKSSRVSSLGP